MLTTRVLEHLLHLTEEEIAQEKAASLGNAGSRLEAILAELAELGARIGGLSAGSERSDAVTAFNALRERAKERYWYLIVQREAMGLSDHQRLEATYVIPPPLR